MIVLKFGGTSVANSKNILKAIDIIKEKTNKHNITVIVSAFSGVTNKIEQCISLSIENDSRYLNLFKQIEKLHLDTIDELIPYINQSELKGETKIILNELEELLQGVFYLKDCSNKIKAKILSYGELLSSLIIYKSLLENNVKINLLDGREIIITNSDFLEGKVDFEKTNKNILTKFSNIRENYIISGYISSNQNTETTTLGRGGSDYTAAIIAATLSAERLEIWTDVDGMKTADPDIVEQAFTINNISYEEAMELSYFGAKVIYPPTIHPILKKNIPILIKNTFNPTNAGTLINNIEEKNQKSSIKGLSSINNVALLTISGGGMVGIPNISKRVFQTISENKINVLFISQASSEHSICIGISDIDAIKAQKKLEQEFEFDIFQNKINNIKIELGLSIIAIVGNGMKHHVGLAGKAFASLGENGINIISIAQGSNERNISFVIKNNYTKKALNVLHENFFLSENKKIHLFFMGIGNVGMELINQIKRQKEQLKKRHKLQLVPIAIGNSKKILINEKSISLNNIKEQINSSEINNDMATFVSIIKKLNLRNSVFIDNTASEEVCKHYKSILDANISIIASNKIAASSDFEIYTDLKTKARNNNIKFLYETNVAAGLPIIRTIQDLIASGDKILKIEAVLSGSLNFIFNTLSKEIPFSEAVKMAKEQGFTEPDPRIDLSGVDVMRKILILSRECGETFNLEDVKVTKFLPETCFKYSEWNKLYPLLKKQDSYFEKLRIDTEKANKKLRVVAIYENGKASVALKQVENTNAAFNLSGKDNIIQITTERYSDFPLVIKGAGAGAQVTASGVFADIMRFANS